MSAQMSSTLSGIGDAAASMTPPAISAPSTPPDDLAARIAALEQRLDALSQQPAAPPRRTWLRDPSRITSIVSAMVAVLAFLLTLTTTTLQFRLTQQQDLHAARRELRELTQRLSQLPRELVDASQTTNDPSVLGNLSGMLQSENAVLAEHAYALMADPAVNASAAEYILVATAMLNSNDPNRALTIFREAAQRVQNANDGVGIYRPIGALLLQMGRFAEGRAAYNEALHIFDRFPAASQTQRDYVNAFTEMKWGQSELIAHQCDEARRHLKAAETTVNALGAAATDPIAQQVNQTKPYLRTCIPAPRPANATDWALQQALR